MISANPVNGSGIGLARDYDARLVSRFKAGDEKAFEEIVCRHRVKVYLIAFGLLHNHEDAEEVAADTFIRAHRGLNNFRGQSSLQTWLSQISINLARNRYWYWWRRKRAESLSLQAPISVDNDTTLSDAIPSGAKNALDQVDLAEVVALVSRSVEGLSDVHKEIVVLRSVQELTYEEIGEVLGLDIGTVKSRLFRARECLRLIVAKAYDEEIAI